MRNVPEEVPNIFLTLGFTDITEYTECQAFCPVILIGSLPPPHPQCCGSGSGIGCLLTPVSGIRDPVWAKCQDPDPGSRINNQDHISLETIFLGKILKFFDADLGSGIRNGDNSDPG